MALPAGRVGVKPDQVDWQGNIIGGGGGSELTPRVEHLEGQVGEFEFLVQDGVAGYKRAGADTFHPFRRIEVYKVTHNNTNFVEVTRFDETFLPSYVFSFISQEKEAGQVQNDIMTPYNYTSSGAHGTGPAVGGTHTDGLIIRQDDNQAVISHKALNSNYYKEFTVVLVW